MTRVVNSKHENILGKIKWNVVGYIYIYEKTKEGENGIFTLDLISLFVIYGDYDIPQNISAY